MATDQDEQFAENKKAQGFLMEAETTLSRRKTVKALHANQDPKKPTLVAPILIGVLCRYRTAQAGRDDGQAYRQPLFYWQAFERLAAASLQTGLWFRRYLLFSSSRPVIKLELSQPFLDPT